MQITVSVSSLSTLSLQVDRVVALLSWSTSERGVAGGVAAVSPVEESAFRVQSIVSLPIVGLGDMPCVELTEELTVTQ